MNAHAARTVWLASYPKSGNTWVRAIVTALDEHPHLFGVDRLAAGSQPHQVAGALAAWGLDPRWLSDDQLDVARAGLIREVDLNAGAAPVLLRKTHERYRTALAGREPFPLDATRAAVLIVRDPRDVACSYADFFGVTLDDAIDAMARDGGEHRHQAALAQTDQPWGTWTSHAMSWLVAEGFPVHVVRYEDLHADAPAALLPVLNSIGMSVTHDQLVAACERTRFDRLQDSEDDRGFTGTSPHATRFFRHGRTDAWRDQLTPGQIDRIESDHGEMMARLGYDTSDAAAKPSAFSGQLRVRTGVLPAALEGSRRPTRWAEVTDRQALVRLRGGAGILVSDGKDALVQPGTSSDAGDWLVQGWGMTLAALQRGMLSLHASTVEVDGRCIAVAGARGAGKSTTSMGLRARGHHLLCDDVTVVEFCEHEARTTPFWRNVHLLEDSARALGVEFDDLPALGGLRAKSAFAPEPPDDRPRRIDSIAILVRDPHATAVRTEVQNGASRMAALLEHAGRDGIAPVILGPERYFAGVARLADLVPVTTITRPAEGWSLDEVLDAIESRA